MSEPIQVQPPVPPPPGLPGYMSSKPKPETSYGTSGPVWNWPSIIVIAFIVIILAVAVIALIDPNRPSVEQRRMNAINEQMRVCMANDYSREECIRLIADGEGR